MRTGETKTDVLPDQEDMNRIYKMLSLDAAGLSACSFCCRCKEGSECIRVANRIAAGEGKRGALWAEEATGLIGRWFEVCT
jgi:NADH:ubiquinone oxidoreductase subunit F (NADH-binding)